MFNIGTDQWHGNIPLNAIQAGPQWYECYYMHCPGDQLIRGIILIPSHFPQFVQACPANDECGIQFNAIAAKGGISKCLHAHQIAFINGIGQVQHEMENNFETTILGQVEGITDCCDGISVTCFPGDAFINTLHANPICIQS